MFEIQWQRYSSTVDTYKVRDYLFKRKKINDHTVYEIWKGGILEVSNLKYFDFIAAAKAIVTNEFGYA